MTIESITDAIPSSFHYRTIEISAIVIVVSNYFGNVQRFLTSRFVSSLTLDLAG